MEGNNEKAARPDDPFGRALFYVSYFFALVGGLFMAAQAVMVVVSVLGRWLFSKPIFGDFEMVAMGTAISVFLFLPYCHMCRGNVLVDLFLAQAPQKIQTLFDVLGALALAVVAGTFAWRMSYGGMDMYSFNEVSYILALPIWWVFPFAVFSFALLTLCALYTAVLDLSRALR